MVDDTEPVGFMPRREVEIDAASGPFSLRRTCGPVVWGGGRWPNVDWIDAALIWCGWEGSSTVWRRVSQTAPGMLAVQGSASSSLDRDWAERVLGVSRRCPPFADPVIVKLADRFAGLRGFAYGSLYEGLVTAIVGQSISLASAATAETRLSRTFHPGVEIGRRRYWPLPPPERLGDAPVSLVRESGVTWRRAESLVAVGQAAAAHALPADDVARGNPEKASGSVRTLPLVGPWTAASALIWGVAAEDVFPVGDAALLRAARAAYARPGLSRDELEQISEEWRFARTWAARFLWAGLFDGAERGELGPIVC